MGGAALKSTYTRRYSKDEYKNVVHEIQNRVPFETHIPLSFGNKDTFGDLDILIRGSDYDKMYGSIPMSVYIEETFKPNEIYANSDVVSFDYKEFQIDFIKVKEHNWETSKIYFSYNDLGNFQGRIAYKMGFRYGNFGLRLVYLHKNGGRKFKLVVSKEPEEIFTFLGFDWKKYQKGFDSLENIFNFIVESKYFNARLFDYDQLNHQNRTRNKKRANYGKFLEYVKSFDNGYVFENKDTFVKMAEDFFGINIVEQIALWNKQIKRENDASSRFNGNLAMKLFPDLKGKKLGLAIMNFKAEVGNDFTDWIISTDQETIWNTFKRINKL